MRSCWSTTLFSLNANLIGSNETEMTPSALWLTQITLSNGLICHTGTWSWGKMNPNPVGRSAPDGHITSSKQLTLLVYVSDHEQVSNVHNAYFTAQSLHHHLNTSGAFEQIFQKPERPAVSRNSKHNPIKVEVDDLSALLNSARKELLFVHVCQWASTMRETQARCPPYLLLSSISTLHTLQSPRMPSGEAWREIRWWEVVVVGGG